jgi:hypothetical protein
MGTRRRATGATEYIWRASSFQSVQAAVALLWRWLSPVKRQQATRALEGFHGRRELIGVRAYRRPQQGAAE